MPSWLQLHYPLTWEVPFSSSIAVFWEACGRKVVSRKTSSFCFQGWIKGISRVKVANTIQNTEGGLKIFLYKTMTISRVMTHRWFRQEYILKNTSCTDISVVFKHSSYLMAFLSWWSALSEHCTKWFHEIYITEIKLQFVLSLFLVMSLILIYYIKFTLSKD